MSVHDEFTIRSITQNEIKAFHLLEDYIWAEVTEEERKFKIIAEWATGVFYRSKIVAACAGLPFKMQLNGCSVPVDGLTSVGTCPGFRRRGLMRRLIANQLSVAHERGKPASVLFASMAAIYQRFGYGLGSTHYRYQFDPRFVETRIKEPLSGYVRLVDQAEAKRVLPELHRTFIKCRNLALDRDGILWEHYFRKRKKPFFYAIAYDINDQPTGYLIFTTGHLPCTSLNDDDPDQKMDIETFVWNDVDSYRALWEFIRSHDLIGQVQLNAPQDDPSISLLLEPRSLRIRTTDGIWLRVIDVMALTKARGYQYEYKAVFEIVEDEMCPWNKGTYRLTTSSNEVEVVRTNTMPDFQISINGLASLLCGHDTLSQLTRVGHAKINDVKKLPRLDALFSTNYRPYCLDDF